MDPLEPEKTPHFQFRAIELRCPAAMFANLLQLITRRTPSDYERNFVREVRVRQRSPRNPKIERLFLWCWVIILVKSFLVLWVVHKYHMSFSANWIIIPTVVAALVCTAAYFWRD